MKSTCLMTAIAMAIALASCNDSPPPPDCETAKFSWKANGVYHEGYVDIYFSSFLQNFSLDACETNGPEVNLRLHTPLGLGTYSLADVQQATGPNTGDAFYYFNTGSGSEFYTTDSTHTGSVTITSFTAPHTISGTFSFTAIRESDSDTVNISEGTFTNAD